ncbi:hypothetical protein ACP70R_037386 [Stipagrostis hirtigluma subsp. patula]
MGSRAPFTDVTNRPKETDEERRKREERNKYQREYRARKRAEAINPKLSTPMSSGLVTAPPTSCGNLTPISTAQSVCNSTIIHGTNTSTTSAVTNAKREERNRKQREYRARKKAEASILRASAAAASGTTTDDPMDWLHRNDNYVRGLLLGDSATRSSEPKVRDAFGNEGSTSKDKLLMRRERYNKMDDSSKEILLDKMKEYTRESRKRKASDVGTRVPVQEGPSQQFSLRHTVPEPNDPEFDSTLYQPTRPDLDGCEEQYHEPDNRENANIIDDQDWWLLGERGQEYESYRVNRHGVDSNTNVDPYDYVYQNLPDRHHVLKRVPDCYYCGAERFQYEPPGFCCRKGKIKVHIPEVPDELKRLFTSQVDNDAKYFRKHIRYFNSHFSFTSLGVTLDHRVSTAAGTGIYTFRVHGGLYHRLDHLVPGSQGPRHMQLYFYDTDDTLSHRAPYHGCYDPLAYPLFFPNGETGWNKFMPYDQLPSETPARATTAELRDDDEEQATCDDHAGQIEEEHDLVENGEDNDMQDGDFLSRVVEAAQSARFVSPREYYCFKLQVRRGLFDILLFGGRLFQQWAVGMYIKIESMRLDWYSNPDNQKLIRAELYQGMVDVISDGETRASEVGKRIVLPRTFPGEDRDMQQRFLNAMALVQRFGKPDYFITMTCNPYWEEITTNLEPGQTPQDRPELVARVYRAKLRDMKDLLIKKKYFGEVSSYAHVTEFQKRGLPHEHILLIMKSNSNLTTPDAYDKVISAEIPDKDKYPVLHDLVINHMLHGPCGALNKNCPCMVDGECRFDYPRQFCPATQQGKDSYPLYRRRDDGRRVKIRGAELDNRWVVPYNPGLLMRYNCHINVEACGSIKAVKYLFKYVYKGHDRASFSVDHSQNESGVINEIRQYRDARYISLPEAVYRIFGFPLFVCYL